ncbi:hypothetical protein KKI19_02950 [Patescibacteria group bacterium]|nr:hypothetical protein [Patescibacteria group bacterium]
MKRLYYAFPERQFYFDCFPCRAHYCHSGDTLALSKKTRTLIEKEYPYLSKYLTNENLDRLVLRDAVGFSRKIFFCDIIEVDEGRTKGAFRRRNTAVRKILNDSGNL